MPVGDIASQERGSGARYNDGKPDLALIPLRTLEPIARVLMAGERKYAAWNWAKGMAWSVPLACSLRHLAAWQAGEDRDPETGENHLAHAAVNLLFLLYYESNYPEGDDRPRRPSL